MTGALKNILGQKFGDLEVVELVDSKPHRKWKCKCHKCGGEDIVEGWQLRGGKKRNCGCHRSGSIDLTNKIFHKLLVLHKNGRDKNRRVLWRCVCDCGGKIDVPTRYLVRGSRRHCGCEPRPKTATPFSTKLSRHLGSYKSNAKKRNLFWNLTKEYFVSIVQQDCFYCGFSPETFNGIDRKDNSIGYEIENCVPCCQRCNFFKRSLSYKDFTSLVFKINDHLKKL